MSHHSQLEWTMQRLPLILHWTHMWLISRFKRQRAAASIIFSWQAVRPTCHQQLMWGILMLMPVRVSLDKMADQLWGRPPRSRHLDKINLFWVFFVGFSGWRLGQCVRILFHGSLYYYEKLHLRQTLRQTADWSCSGAWVQSDDSSAYNRHINWP